MRPAQLERALAAQPLLLASAEHRLGLLWSAKAGCTFAVKWFFSQLDLLPAATFYHPWVHNFRSEVFYRSRGSIDALASPDLFRFRFVRLVRNPHHRCVSAYLAMCHVAHTARNGMHSKLLDAIGEQIARPVGPDATFSYREFVDFLATIDLDTCDIHVRRQTHPLERLGVLEDVSVVRLEESLEVLPKIEARLALRAIDLGALRNSPHHARKGRFTGLCADRHFHDTVAEPTPAAEQFHDDRLTDQVRHLYAEDFERYGY